MLFSIADPKVRMPSAGLKRALSTSVRSAKRILAGFPDHVLDADPIRHPIRKCDAVEPLRESSIVDRLVRRPASETGQLGKHAKEQGRDWLKKSETRSKVRTSAFFRYVKVQMPLKAADADVAIEAMLDQVGQAVGGFRCRLLPNTVQTASRWRSNA